MMNILKHKKFLVIFTVITIGVFIASLIYRPQAPEPELLMSIPTQNAQKVSLTNPIQLKFDQKIDPSLLAINSEPSEVWSTQIEGDGSLLTLKSKQLLRVETKYSLHIAYQNQPLYTLNFKTLPQQGDPRYTQEVLLEMDRDYPLSTKLPYTTNSYRVVYSAPMTLEISLKNTDLSSADAISEIKSWVTKNGGDSMAHKYIVK